MGFDRTPVDVYVVFLKAFGTLLFEELQVIVVCEVAEGAFSLLWGGRRRCRILCCQRAW